MCRRPPRSACCRACAATLRSARHDRRKDGSRRTQTDAAPERDLRALQAQARPRSPATSRQSPLRVQNFTEEWLKAALRERLVILDDQRFAVSDEFLGRSRWAGDVDRFPEQRSLSAIPGYLL